MTGSAAASMQERRAELLDDLVEQTELVVAEFGLPSDLGQHLGHALADYLADHWAGQVISYPKDSAYKLSLRERTILAEHRAGDGIATLAKRYKMGERGLRRLLKRAESRDADRNQQELQFDT